ncbi:putative RNA-binding protein EIF1AD [Amblyomma americanum]|uniref:Probable RNA-binding protein EIF1AD n=1 Tax=Amblyomma americanum TaxID=6943 RepID=A0AAQ4F505_AMBAM
MSQTTKIKHVTKEVLEEYVLPKENQQIVRVLGGRGNNLHEVEDPSGTNYLVSMPVKFRKNIWIKRGDFVIVEPIEEGDKVKAEIQRILYRDQIKYIKEEGLWPKPFDNGSGKGNGKTTSPKDGDDGSDLFVNTNRPSIVYEESDSSATESEDDDDAYFCVNSNRPVVICDDGDSSGAESGEDE